MATQLHNGIHMKKRVQLLPVSVTLQRFTNCLWFDLAIEINEFIVTRLFENCSALLWGKD